MKIKSEDVAKYTVDTDNNIIAQALAILTARLKVYTVCLDSPSAVRDYLVLTLGSIEHEEFYCLWLSSQNKLIAAEKLFRGTLNQAAVYSREIVKSALTHNACAVILAHNHPSGNGAPSSADKTLTLKIKAALALIDVTVLDHLVVAGARRITSFAEQGLL